MNGIFVILFNNMVQNVESFRATLVIFFKFYRTNFWLALEQTAGGVIWIISRRRLSRATLKRITYDSSVLFRNKAPERRSVKRSAWLAKRPLGRKTSLIKINKNVFALSDLLLIWKLLLKHAGLKKLSKNKEK